MNTNVRVIEAIQCITAIGLDMAKAADCIEDLEQSVSYWKNSAREFERRLDVAEANVTTVRTRNEALAKEFMETKELLERANMEVDASRARIEELETELGAALTANWTEAVVPKLTAPATEPEVVYEPEASPEDLAIVAEDGVKRNYYFKIASSPSSLTSLTAVKEISKRRYVNFQSLQGYISYHESQSTARNNKFMDLVEMYPPTGYAIEFNSEADQQAYSFAKGKYKALNTAQPAIALASTKAEGEANE